MGEDLGNGLTQSAVNTKTRQHIRRIGTGRSQINGINGHATGHLGPDHGDMDPEVRPLLGHRISSHHSSGFWRHLLLNPRSSPGTDSPNPLVRWPAYLWNVTKVTLLSCMCPSMSDDQCPPQLLT
jgi:Ca2+:H+ antiporter